MLFKKWIEIMKEFIEFRAGSKDGTNGWTVENVTNIICCSWIKNFLDQVCEKKVTKILW